MIFCQLWTTTELGHACDAFVVEDPLGKSMNMTSNINAWPKINKRFPLE